MQIKTRTGILLFSWAMALGLAGCQTPGDFREDKGTAASIPDDNSLSSADDVASDNDSSQQAPVLSSVGFYLAQTQEDSNLMAVRLNDTTIYVQREPALTREDLSEAAALVDKAGKNFIGLRFTPEGARKLRTLSSQNIGKLLTLMIDGQLVAAPRIVEPLNHGVLAFSVDTAQFARDVAAKVRGEAQSSSN